MFQEDSAGFLEEDTRCRAVNFAKNPLKGTHYDEKPSRVFAYVEDLVFIAETINVPNCLRNKNGSLTTPAQLAHQKFPLA